MSIEKQLWKRFYTLEEDYLDWLNHHSDCLYETPGNQAVYIKHEDANGEVWSRPPQYIRKVCYLNAKDFALARTKANLVREAYHEAYLCSNPEAEPDSVSFPERFPLFVENVTDVRVSQNNAAKSLRLDSENGNNLITIKSYDMDSETEMMALDEDQRVLKEHGFKDIDVQVSNRFRVKRLRLHKSDFLLFFKAERLQLRVVSGKQYVARVLKEHDESLRMKLGLLVLNSHAPVLESLPRKTRSDKLNPKDSLNSRFPLPLPFLVYQK